MTTEAEHLRTRLHTLGLRAMATVFEAEASKARQEPDDLHGLPRQARGRGADGQGRPLRQRAARRRLAPRPQDAGGVRLPPVRDEYERERRMRRFKRPGQAQHFLAADGPIASHCRPRRHRLTAAAHRQPRAERFRTWRAVTGTPALA